MYTNNIKYEFTVYKKRFNYIFNVLLFKFIVANI